MKNKVLTRAQKDRIIGVVKAVKSYRKAQALLRKQKIYVSLGGISKMINRLKKTRSLADRKRSGRPRLTTRWEQETLRRIAVSNRTAPTQQVTNRFNDSHPTPISRSTATRRLKEYGLSRRPALKKPSLTPRQKDSRLTYARGHLNKPALFWHRVLFTDEKMFSTVNNRTRTLVTRKGRERLLPQCVCRSRNWGLNVHVWGAISWWGVGPIRRIEGNLGAQKYITEVISDTRQLCTIDRAGRQEKLLFQQDNAPAHSAIRTRTFLEQNGVRTMQWPPNSPDLNPIEDVWWHVDRRVRGRGQPQTQAELWEWIQAVAFHSACLHPLPFAVDPTTFARSNR